MLIKLKMRRQKMNNKNKKKKLMKWKLKDLKNHQKLILNKKVNLKEIY